jgi:hypothetical protein
MHTDHSRMKLGKQQALHDPRTLQLTNYLKPEALPPPPAAKDWGKGVGNWGMMLNDTIGDCTCAAAGHLIMEWTANAGKEITPSDGDILKAYEAVSGYNPETHANDNGAVETTVLKYWRKTGIAGHKIGAFAALTPGNRTHIEDGAFLFEGVYIGLALPVSAQRQAIWATPPQGPTGTGAPGSWGGHAVPIVAYDARGLTCITWGQRKRMTWDFWNNYCDEAYAILSQDLFEPNAKSPAGFDLAQLQADLGQVTG